MSILCVGVTTVDLLVPVDGIPPPDSKTRSAGPTRVAVGGNAANTALAVAGAAPGGAGAAVSLCSVVGDDPFAGLVLEALDAAGVDRRAVVERAGARTALSHVLVGVHDQTRTIIHSASDAADLEASVDCAASLSALDAGKFKVVYCDGRHTLAAADLASRAAAAGVPVVVEAERPRPHLDALLAHADLLFASREFLAAAFPGVDILAAMGSLLDAHPRGRAVVSTLGARGALYRERGGACPSLSLDEIVAAAAPATIDTLVGPVSLRTFNEGGLSFVAAAPVDAVTDTTGAGDAFAAGLLVAWGRRPRELLATGAILAARRCARPT